MNYKRERDGNIEIFRFLFSLAIVGWHGHFDVRGGYLGVEFFFMLSGAYMAKSIAENSTKMSETISRSFAESRHYLIKRIKKIYPSFLISTFIGIGVTCWAKHGNISIIQIIGDFLFLQNYGYPVLSATGVLWYLSALFFGIWLIYPFLSRYYYIYVKYFALIIYLLISGVLINKYGTMDMPCSFYGPINTGFLRAVGAISLGTLTYEISKKISSFSSETEFFHFLLSLFEILLWFIVFAYMTRRTDSDGSQDGIIVLTMSLALGIALSQITTLPFLLRFNKVATFLGKISSVLFMNHLYWFYYLADIFGYPRDEREIKINLVALGMSFAATFLVIVLEKPFIRFLLYIKRKLFLRCQNDTTFI